MTKTLILMRHAKSSWDHPGLEDHARPLNKRGRKSAKVLGTWLRANDLVPDEVLSSDSERTRETFALLGLDLAADFTRALYHADAMAMQAVLRGATGDRVLMIGHNPGISEFAINAIDEPPQHTRFFDYPTGATLVADFPIDDWTAFRWSTGHAAQFVVPRELPGFTETAG